MKGADKAIVAKSFGKWKNSSLRSRTMEKPDEPSEESKEESLSNCTCEAPQLGKKPVGKTTLFSYFNSFHTAVSLQLFPPVFPFFFKKNKFLLAAMLIITALTYFFFLPFFLSSFFPLPFDSVACHIR